MFIRRLVIATCDESEGTWRESRSANPHIAPFKVPYDVPSSYVRRRTLCCLPTTPRKISPLE